MLIYRYEMPDHGGPYFTLDGFHRRSGVKISSEPSDYVFGFNSIDKLNSYFNNSKDLKECKLVTYNIPDSQIFIVGDQVAFPKHYLDLNIL